MGGRPRQGQSRKPPVGCLADTDRRKTNWGVEVAHLPRPLVASRASRRQAHRNRRSGAPHRPSRCSARPSVYLMMDGSCVVLGGRQTLLETATPPRLVLNCGKSSPFSPFFRYLPPPIWSSLWRGASPGSSRGGNHRAQRRRPSWEDHPRHAWARAIHAWACACKKLLRIPAGVRGPPPSTAGVTARASVMSRQGPPHA